jgi:iron(III) transport system ATP-binding protein
MRNCVFICARSCSPCSAKLGVTTIFVTHDQEEALSISDRVAVLDGGVIQQVGTPMELFDRPANRFIASFVGTINLLSGTAHTTADGTTFESPLLGRLALPRTSAVSGSAEIAFRPHTLTLASPDRAGSADKVWMQGSVAHANSRRVHTLSHRCAGH